MIPGYRLAFFLVLVQQTFGQSLFDTELDANRKLSLGVNLPPKFLPGGDMDNFSLPEDTPVGTMVSSNQFSHVAINISVYNVFYHIGLSSERRRP